MGHTTSTKGAEAWLYQSTEFDQKSITLRAKALGNPLEVENKATFEIQADDTLYHTWQFQSEDEQWIIGDYLRCQRVLASK